MHFNHDFIVFDLETTDTEWDRRIIEIGACRISRDLEIQDTFYTKVFPGIVVSDYVLQLTANTQEELNKAPQFTLAIEQFEKWVGNIKRHRLAAWGNYFDVNVLRKEYGKWGRPYPFSGTVYDVKTVALGYLAVSGRRTDSCSVASMVKLFGGPDGPYHNALFDAEQTARIFRQCLIELSESVWINKERLVLRRG